MQSRDSIFEFVREAGRHLTQAFEIILQRDLFTKLSHLRNVSQQTQRASRSLRTLQFNGSNGCAEPAFVTVSANRVDLGTPVQRAFIKTLADHLRQRLI